ncbi:25346_t:CDS:2, partial [Racocetra persica]
IHTILANKDVINKPDNQNIITHAYLYTKSKHRSFSNNWDKLLFINDDKRFIIFSERLDLIPKQSTIMVRKLSSEDELIKVSIHLLIPPIPVCRPHVPLYGEPSIAIVTSSYFYDNINNCSPSMLDVAYILSENKRTYAQKHGYAFIPRSLEFQLHLNLWGKIDAVKKVLPYYDWILWIDNDAIITNQEISILELFTRFYQLIKNKNDAKNNAKHEKIIENEKMVHQKRLEDSERYYDEGGPLDYADDDDINYGYESLFDYDFDEDEEVEDDVKLFDERIHFIISKPKKDAIFNTGAFLIKNSEWSFEFLKKVQEIEVLHGDGQASMGQLINQYPSLRDHNIFLRSFANPKKLVYRHRRKMVVTAVDLHE